MKIDGTIAQSKDIKEIIKVLDSKDKETKSITLTVILEIYKNNKDCLKYAKNVDKTSAEAIKMKIEKYELDYSNN